MTKKYIKQSATGFRAKASPSKNNLLDPKLPDCKQHTLLQELKASGSIDIPRDYNDKPL